MDLSPCAVSGAIELARARVIWRDGKLFLFTSKTDAVVVAAADRPVRAAVGTGYTTTGVTFERSGCKCGCAFCKTSAFRIMQPVLAGLESGDVAVLELADANADA